MSELQAPAAGNSQCLVPSAFSVSLQSFAGDKVIYVAARDVADLLSSGWQVVGT